MPKGKNHKGLLKRVRVTGRGKVKHNRAGTSHLMSHKSGKRGRQLRHQICVPRPVAKEMEKILHRRLKGREQA
jgi:large subunit ribosomal protein L35